MKIIFRRSARDADRQLGIGIVRLKSVLQRELHDAWIVHRLGQCAQSRGCRRRGLAESRRDKCCLRRVEIWVIRKVEYLPAKFHLLALTNREKSRQPGVDDDRAGAKQAVVFQIAESVRSWGRESTGVNPKLPILDRRGSIARWIGSHRSTLVWISHQIGTLCESVPTPRKIEDEYWREIQTRLYDGGDG